MNQSLKAKKNFFRVEKWAWENQWRKAWDSFYKLSSHTMLNLSVKSVWKQLWKIIPNCNFLLQFLPFTQWFNYSLMMFLNFLRGKFKWMFRLFQHGILTSKNRLNIQIIPKRNFLRSWDAKVVNKIFRFCGREKNNGQRIEEGNLEKWPTH